MTYYEGGKMQYEDGQKFIRLTEDEILFEAANTVRMGKDLLYLVSRSGNYLGAKWLQTLLGEEYRVHTTEEIYRSSHIDSSVLCLRPGLVLLNTERVNPSTCPKVLNKWEKVYFSDITPIPDMTIQFHEEVRKKVSKELDELGIRTSIDSISSKWIGMNILSVDPQTVIVDERQVPLMRLLEEHHITPVPIRFRHSYYMGGIHCSTLDTVRDSILESYCD
jgi:glycine amidinotransferase/scyllo-inosamine-4-phosphate amidinotransferase 1